VKPIPRVIELDRRQPEFTLTFAQYMKRVVTDRRVAKGRERLRQHRDLLNEVAQKYGVQPRFIVALWGIETDFGRITGGFPVLSALATLAHDGRRSAFFRKELLLALKIVDGGHIRAADMKGSWAGAMGQNQFMPSSFHAFAVDHDGDGRKDIWTNLPDVFASIANYLSGSGWRVDQTWGRAVSLPAGMTRGEIGRKKRQLISAWQARGVRRTDGSDLPTRDLMAAIVAPQRGALAPAFLVYNNYNVILKWNRSDYFATAVGRLADRLAAGG
jgi:membrane-bound lytic murein transglycosylase B